MATRSHLSIGEVLSLLREEFPDITISKIRFLESQGLVDPERTPSGYRKFYEHDVERLRWILRQQRENFLPLKVIKGRLSEQDPEATDANEQLAWEAAAIAGVAASSQAPASGRPPEVEATEAPLGGRPERPMPAPDRPAAVPTGADAGPMASGPAHSSTQPPVSTQPSAGAQPSARTTPTEQPPAGSERSGHERDASSARRPAPEDSSPDPISSRDPNGSPDPASAPARASAAAASDAPARGGTQRASGSATARAPASSEPAGSSAPADPAPADPPADPAPTGDARSSAGDEAVKAGNVAAGPSEGAAGAGDAPTRATDKGSAPTMTTAAKPVGSGAPAAAAEVDSYTAAELAEVAGVDLADVKELQGFGLLQPRSGAGGAAYFDLDALDVVRLAAAFARHGVEARHLRAWKTSAEREASLFEQVIMPLLHQRNPQARRQALETLDELAGFGAALRDVLVRQALRAVR